MPAAHAATFPRILAAAWRGPRHDGVLRFDRLRADAPVGRAGTTRRL